MAEVTEEMLNYWSKPPSDTEEQKLVNAVNMVKDAVTVMLQGKSDFS